MNGTTLRSFEPARDYPAIAALIAASSAHSGQDWFPTEDALRVEWAASPRFDPERDIVLADAPGGSDGSPGTEGLIGLARTAWREREGAIIHNIGIWVHPDHGRRGLGSELLAWSEARARAVAATHTSREATVEHRFGGVTTLNDPVAVAFAERNGYRSTRFHYEMRRDLAEPIPDVPMPPGLEVRPVDASQHRAIWTADAEAFRDHWDAAVVDEDDFQRFFAHPDVDTSLWQVGWEGDEIAGSVLCSINRNENEQIGVDIGWLDSVSTRRPWRRRGLASALIARSLTTLRERGMTVAQLGVDTESPTGALGVYERLGFRPVKTFAFYRKPF